MSGSKQQPFAKVGRRRVTRRGGEEASDPGLIPDLVITNSFFTSTVNPAGQGASEQLFRTTHDVIQRADVAAHSSLTSDQVDELTMLRSSAVGPTQFVEEMPTEFLRGAQAVKHDADVAWGGLPPSPAHGLGQAGWQEQTSVASPISVKDRLAHRAEGIRRAKAEASALAAEAKEAERAEEEQQVEQQEQDEQDARRGKAPASVPERQPSSVPIPSSSSTSISASQQELEKKAYTPFAKPRGESRLERERAETVAPAAISRKRGPALLADTIAVLPVDISRHRLLLLDTLTDVAANAHRYFCGSPEAVAPAHLQLLSELLRASMVSGDAPLTAALVRVLHLLLQLAPFLAAASAPRCSGSLVAPRGWGEEASERSLLSHLTRIALGHASPQASGDAARCLEAFLGSGSAGQRAIAAGSSALEFCLGCAFALAQEGLPVPFDNFLLVAALFCRHVRVAAPAVAAGVGADGRFDPNLQTSSSAALCQSFALALSALTPRVEPCSFGRASGFGNGLSLASCLPVLLSVHATFRAPRRALLSLFSALARLHPLHPALLLEAGAGRIVRDHALHCCLLASRGLAAEATEAQVLAGCLDVMAALLGGCMDPVARAACRCMYPPFAPSSSSSPTSLPEPSVGDDSGSPVLSVAQLRLLAALTPRHCASPAYASLLRYTACLLDAQGDGSRGGGSGTLAPSSSGGGSGQGTSLCRWLAAAVRAAREEVLFGARVRDNCLVLAVLGPALRAARGGEGAEGRTEREVQAAVAKLVTEGGAEVVGHEVVGPECFHALLVSRDTGQAAFSALYLQQCGTKVRGGAQTLAACLPPTLASELFPAAPRLTRERTMPPPPPPSSQASAGAVGSAAFYGRVAAAARAFMHPVRLFAWPSLPSPALHQHLLTLLALSRGPAFPPLTGTNDATPGSGAFTGLLLLQTRALGEAAGGYDLVSLGELAGLLSALLTGAQAVVAAPSNPSSTVGTYLLVPHAHTQQMSKGLPAMRLTALLLLTDIFSLPRPPLPLPDPLPAVRSVCARIEAARHALPSEASGPELQANLRFLAAAARVASLLGALSGPSSLSPAVAAQTPTHLSRPAVLEAINDALGRSGAGQGRLLGLLWSLLRSPGVLDAVSASAHGSDAVAALLLRWVLCGLRAGCGEAATSAGAGPSAAGLSLALDTCVLLQQLACPLRCHALCQPAVGQGLFRFVLSRPETEEALLRLARGRAGALAEAVAKTSGGDSGPVAAASAALCCVLDALHGACELYNPLPHVGYDCPGLFFPASLQTFSDRLLAASGLPFLLGSCLESCRKSALAALAVHPSLLRLAAAAVEAEAALGKMRARGADVRAGSEAGIPCLEWTRVSAFPLARAYLSSLLSSSSTLLFFNTADGEGEGEGGGVGAVETAGAADLAAARRGVGGWAAASAWERVGASSAALVAALLLAAPAFVSHSFSNASGPPPPALSSSPTASAPDSAGLQAVLDCLLDVLPESRPGSASWGAQRLVELELSGCIAALAALGCDIASAGRGQAVLALLESATAAAAAAEDPRLHNHAARLMTALARSSDVLRDIICRGGLLRYLALVLLHLRGGVELSRAVGMLREDARIIVDVDVLWDGSTAVLACQAVAALSNTAARAERLMRACIPASVLWLMSKHPSYRGSLKMQKLGLAALLAVWLSPRARQQLLIKEGHEETVARAAGMLGEALERHGGLGLGSALGWSAGERRFVSELLQQVAGQRSEADCLMS